MKALVLEDVERFSVRDLSAPSPGPRDVLIQVGAAGICGTDLHIYHGYSNYHRDAKGRQIPLTESPQVLGHEFCGTVVEVGNEVRKFKPGDRVIADQVLNCHSHRREPICEYCESGDSHQCAHQEELGITGQPGAFADLICVPEINLILLPEQVSFAKGAMVEPLACVLHACDRMEASRNRYTFSGHFPIRNILITGAGPSGLLFLQYLRNIRGFDGQIFVADMRESRLAVAEKFGGTALDIRDADFSDQIRERTRGELIHYMIEASGAGSVFDLLPIILRHQATFLFYGAGHAGRDIGLACSFQYMEFNVVTTSGASGNFDPDGTPVIYRRAMEYLRDGRIDADSLLTHVYRDLADLPKAFAADSLSHEYIKGAWVRNLPQPQ